MGNFEFSTEGGGGRRVTKERVIGLYKLQFFFSNLFEWTFYGQYMPAQNKKFVVFLAFRRRGGRTNVGKGF